MHFGKHIKSRGILPQYDIKHDKNMVFPQHMPTFKFKCMYAT